MGCLKIHHVFCSEPKMFIEKKNLTSIKSKNKILSCYVFGFNGQERDDETYGEGNAINFGERINDTRLGRWFSPDFVSNTSLSCYVFASNNPIVFVDPDGNDEFIFHSDGTTSYIKRGWVQNLFHKHVVKVELPNGKFLVAAMQDQKNDPLRYQGKLVEGSNSYSGGRPLPNPTKVAIVNHNDLMDATSGCQNSKLNIREDGDFGNADSYNPDKDGEVVGWMRGQGLDWGYRCMQEDEIYIVQDPSGDYTAYNRQNFGNYIYGYYSQRLGLTRAEIQLLAQGYNKAEYDSWDSSDDQDAITSGWVSSYVENGSTAHKDVSINLLKNLKDLKQHYNDHKDDTKDVPREEEPEYNK